MFVAVPSLLGKPLPHACAPRQQARRADIDRGWGASNFRGGILFRRSRSSTSRRPARDPADHGKKHVAYDGGTQSSNFFPFDGDFARAAAGPAASTALSILAARRARRRTICAATRGQPALDHRQRRRPGDESRVDVRRLGNRRRRNGRHRRVELAPADTRITSATFRTAGRLHVHVGEGRSFLRASPQDVRRHPDLQQLHIVERGRGVRGVQPVYLQTIEAYVRVLLASGAATEFCTSAITRIRG